MSGRVIIVIRETRAESLLRDAVTIALAWALILPGWAIGSAVAQGFGAAIMALFLVNRSLRVLRDSTMSVDQAAALIDRLRREGQP